MYVLTLKYNLKYICLCFSYVIIYICLPHPILGSLKCERFYLHFYILHCLTIKERLAKDFLIANTCIYKSVMSLSSINP